MMTGVESVRELLVAVKIAVIDDDESVRESLPHLLGLFGFAVAQFASAEDFLRHDDDEFFDCLIIDVAMPGMSGPELQKTLVERQCAPPIVFITADQDEKLCARLESSGAIACLRKPFSEDSLLQAVRLALSYGKGSADV